MNNWDLDKKKAFVSAMGKKRASFSKGGLVRRLGNLKYFDDGGTVLGGPQAAQTTSQTVNNNGLTGSIGNALGLNNEFQAQGVPIQAGTNQAQLNQAYQGVQGGLGLQTGLANQLAPGGQQGTATQAALTGQLQGVINGTGPNAAQTALNQNTAQNVANQASLMAGQRGASSNVGLLARQAAMQGANTQQQAVGEGATLQAQQQIAAQQQLQNLAQTQVGQQAASVQGVNQAQQGEQGILQNANQAYNNANVTMQSNLNNVNSQVAAGNQQQAGNVVGMLSSVGGGLLGGLGGSLGFAKGGEIPHLATGGPLMVAQAGPAQGYAPGAWSNPTMPAASFGNVGSAPGPAAPLTIPQSEELKKAGKKAGTAIGNKIKPPEGSEDIGAVPVVEGGAGSATGPEYGPSTAPTGALAPGEASDSAFEDMITDSAALAKGGEVPHLDQGGMLQNALKLAPLAILALKDGGRLCKGPHQSHVANFLHGGMSEKVPAMVSPGEVYLSPEKVRQVIHEGKNPLKIGEHIKGKAKVKGDSLKNDTVPKTLEEGGVVIPRHVMKKMSPEKAELFVHRAMARKKVGK